MYEYDDCDDRPYTRDEIKMMIIISEALNNHHKGDDNEDNPKSPKVSV